MLAILLLLAALATLLDFVLIFSCLWLKRNPSEHTKGIFGSICNGWSAISIIVGVLCLVIPIYMFMNYWRLPHDSASHSSSLSWRPFTVTIGLAFPTFPLVLGYILRRFSRELRS